MRWFHPTRLPRPLTLLRRPGSRLGLESLETRDLLSGTPLFRGTTGTGLDQLVQIIASDKGLARNIPASEIVAGARAANAMNHLIIEAIKATGVAADGVLSSDDVRQLNAYLRGKHLDEWTRLHGDDEDGVETGFHLVQNDGASTKLLGKNAVDTVADGIYHPAFDIVDDRFLNEDGNANACVKDVASWLNQLLAADLANGSLAPAPRP